MKVLMFGWEFPPHIAGGLGTACYGLTRGLAAGGVQVTFVMPRAWGDEDGRFVRVVSASEVEIPCAPPPVLPGADGAALPGGGSGPQATPGDGAETSAAWEENVTFVEVDSDMVPYMSPERFRQERRSATAFTPPNAPETPGAPAAPETAAAPVSAPEAPSAESPGNRCRYRFSGRYGAGLMEEVARYGQVGGQLAADMQDGFDVIHAHDWLAYPAGIAAKRASGRPLVVHIHATEFDRSGENVNRAVYEIEKAGMEAADRVIAVSNLTRRTVVERYGIAPEKVVTVHNAVRFAVSPSAGADRALPDRIVTFLGRITYQKGPDYFVEAAAKVLRRLNGVRFVMAGSGDLMEHVVRRVAQLGISDRFHFTGFLRGDDVNRMFAMSDVYVMPSVSEPFGISPLEAMRANVPVIISRQSGVAEVLDYAVKVDYWDVDAMADAIYGLVAYPALSRLFAEKGREEVTGLKWDRAAAEVKKVYESVTRESD